MPKPKPTEELVERIGAALPADAGVLREEFSRNVRALVENAFARMDLVTREEYEAQADVLRRAREQLEALQARLDALEQERDGA